MRRQKISLLFYVIVLSLALGTHSLQKEPSRTDANEATKQQHVIRRHANLVGWATHLRDNPPDVGVAKSNEVGQEDDTENLQHTRQLPEDNSSGDNSNKTVRRHVNKVGAAARVRDHLAGLSILSKLNERQKIRQVFEANMTADNETKSSIRRHANLVGRATHLRDNPPDVGVAKSNEVGQEDDTENLQHTRQLPEDNSSGDNSNKTVRRHVNKVGAAARVRDHLAGLSILSKLNERQKIRQVFEANMTADNETKSSIRRHANLVGLATRLREKNVDNDAYSLAESEDLDKQRLIIESRQTMPEGSSVDSVNDFSIPKRIQKHQADSDNTTTQPIESTNTGNGPTKLSIRRHANLVGQSSHLRDLTAHMGMGSLELGRSSEDDKVQVRQIQESNGKPKRIEKQSKAALLKRDCVDGFNCNEQIGGAQQAASDDKPKEGVRRQANLVGFAAQQRDNKIVHDGVIEADEDDGRKMQKTRQIFNDEMEDDDIAPAEASEPLQPSPVDKRQGNDISTDNSVIPELEEEIVPDTGTPREETSDYDPGYSLARDGAVTNDPNEESSDSENAKNDKCFTLFTIAGTDIGIDFNKVPYRERYLWDKVDAPCHSFNLRIPDETEERSQITLCVYRPTLDFPDETKLFVPNSGSTGSDDSNNNNNYIQPQQRVVGYVMHTAVSNVFGRVVDRQFFGEVSIFSEHTPDPIVYVVEEIELLNRLMRSSHKSIAHMLMVMHGKGNEKQKPQVQYNAVVTKGASLIDFMVFSSPNDLNRNSFILLSTSHNSYICPGEAALQMDDSGEVVLESEKNQISINPDGSIHMFTDDKVYTFRPHGRTIVTQGMEVRTLQEHEGSVAISAFTKTAVYDCVLPTPAFQQKRKGGYVCKVCVAVDHLFYQLYIANRTTDTEKAGLYISRIIDHVSWIFRSFDIDNDKRPDNVGLEYDAQSVRWTYPDNNQEDLTEQDVEVMFQSLGAYDFTECCLGIGFTMKNLPDNSYGIRPIESSESKTKLLNPSGVCGGKTGRIPNNLIIISGNNKKGGYQLLTEKQLIYLTTHEIASAFGALTDGNGGEDSCDQFLDDHKATRHYLMWPDVIRNTTLKEQSLSSCSKKDIVKTLSSCKSFCFDVDKHPFCGNGIVEEGEECDCGSEFSCRLQTCCYSRVGKHPCRKSGIGCRSDNSASTTGALQKGLLIILCSLLAISPLHN